MDIDLVNRDPNSINDHIQIGFEDVFAEPDSIHSIDCVWLNSYKCFNLWKTCCYNLHTVLCGLCIAAHWGCEFGVLAFTHIWYVSPCMRMLTIECQCLEKFYAMCARCAIAPCCDACGNFFNAFRKG